MWTEQQYELAAKLAESEREAALAAVRQRMSQAGSQDGSCQDCGEQIGQARLAVLPSAARCVDCQTVHEKKQSRFAR